jgi:RNA polymerase primary sigma factor
MTDGFTLFLARIGETPLLTHAAQLGLARRVERGDLAAKERMVRPTCALSSTSQSASSARTMDWRCPTSSRRARSALVRAVEKFDPRFRFSTYATI